VDFPAPGALTAHRLHTSVPACRCRARCDIPYLPTATNQLGCPRAHSWMGVAVNPSSCSSTLSLSTSRPPTPKTFSSSLSKGGCTAVAGSLVFGYPLLFFAEFCVLNWKNGEFVLAALVFLVAHVFPNGRPLPNQCTPMLTVYLYGPSKWVITPGGRSLRCFLDRAKATGPSVL
jgi:hypothetical protein